MNLLEGLNEHQKEAAQTIDGPLLILAGAGSGKTRALTFRIAHMIKDHGIAPDQILAVTFTNKAAHEMKERVEELLGNEVTTLPLVGTFHSVCVRILRQHIHLIGYENAFTIYDTADQRALMKSIFKERRINEKQFNPKAVLGAISNAKNELITPAAFKQRAQGSFNELVAELYPIYQRALAASQALDFDDIIMKTVELFTHMPEVLTKLQERFRYISVDEYQDTNHAQYILVNMLAQAHRNICVIGDDWQSIYSWRGANIQNILNFEKDYPDAKVIKLEQNYRSTNVIVEAANAVVAMNQERTNKKLWSDRESEELITILDTYNERDEVEKVIHHITNHMLEPGVSFSDVVILYRTNAQSRVLEEGMMRHGLPYKIVGGVKFYERKEIKDVLSYLRLIQNPRDDVAFGRIVNVPSRKIGAKTLQVLRSISIMQGVSMLEAIDFAEESLELNNGAKRSLAKFREIMKELVASNREFAASGVIKHILKIAGYERFLLDGTQEGEERFANVEELISVATKYDGLEAGISLATFLEEVALVSDTDQLTDQDDAVTLMTLHSSKGLEYRFVFIVGLEDGLFPSSRSQLDPKSLEEERRLMYVGMTRAKEKLYLSFTQNRLLYGSYQTAMPSRFIDEIPEQYIEGVVQKEKLKTMLDDAYDEVSYTDLDESRVSYDTGDVIEHMRFGQGVVMETKGDILTVKFKNPLYGMKKIAANVAPIRKL